MRVYLIVLLFSACTETAMLPASRNTTYAPGSQVKSADLNALQDQIIAMNGLRTLTIPAIVGRPQVPGEWPAFGAIEVVDTSDAPNAYLIPLLVESGQVITVSILLAETNAIAGGTVHLGRGPMSGGGEVSVATVAIPAVAVDLQTIILVTNHAVVANSAYAVYVNFAAAAGAKAIRAVKVDYTRP